MKNKEAAPQMTEISDTHRKILGKRIDEVARSVGGKRKLSQITGISESQIHKYIAGASEPISSKLALIANAGNVDIAWLVSDKYFTPVAGGYDSKTERNERSEDSYKEYVNYIDKICQMKGFKLPEFTKETLVNIRFSGDITDNGLLMLISVLKVDYERMNSRQGSDAK